MRSIDVDIAVTDIYRSLFADTQLAHSLQNGIGSRFLPDILPLTDSHLNSIGEEMPCKFLRGSIELIADDS